MRQSPASQQCQEGAPCLLLEILVFSEGRKSPVYHHVSCHNILDAPSFYKLVIKCFISSALGCSLSKHIYSELILQLASLRGSFRDQATIRSQRSSANCLRPLLQFIPSTDHPAHVRVRRFILQAASEQRSPWSPNRQRLPQHRCSSPPSSPRRKARVPGEWYWKSLGGQRTRSRHHIMLRSRQEVQYRTLRRMCCGRRISRLST